jgi:basic amino acid/polyamine antiporter, APA family
VAAVKILVAVTLLGLACFVFAGIPSALEHGATNLVPFFSPSESGSPLGSFLEACALMFVAFTGYGRIATLGEEVTEPHTTIPRAIIVTLVVSSLLYIAVGLVGFSAAGSSAMASAAFIEAAPLDMIARGFRPSFVAKIVAAAAVTAMLGVLLNLVLGLSRVVLAMGRRGDLPRATARLDRSETTPYVAVVLVGLVIAALTLIGNVKTLWSFSAFTVLIYYALTNLSATRLNASERIFPRFIPWAGLLSCLALAFWVEPRIWGTGLALIVVGLLYQKAIGHWSPPT